MTSEAPPPTTAVITRNIIVRILLYTRELLRIGSDVICEFYNTCYLL